MTGILLAGLFVLPLAGVVFNSFFPFPRWGSAVVGILSCTGSFLLSLLLWVGLKDSSLVVVWGDWMTIESFRIRFSFLLDSLSLMMLLLISSVASLIYIFSVYYMSEDKSPARYFIYLNLFVLSMMVLVLAEDLALIFLGWEAVGLCSYLLIGFWFEDSYKAACGMKAFIVNRVGDMGFLLALFVLVYLFQSLSVTELKALSGGLSSGEVEWVQWACLFLFVGAVGKSAQIPLYMWLPSAMAGPTPVSALIHAATMVTAGVYLLVRLDFLFSLAPWVLNIVAVVGTLTAFLAALTACVQTDIKKVLAYSTVSQLGYMFLAAGLKAYVPAFFHLLCHGFFKALLFLAAGSVIHALHGEQNIERMGGLRKHLPWTAGAFGLGGLALIGVFPFSGFFSKDEILWAAFHSHPLFFVPAFLTALLTAFYMIRVFVLVFCGSPRSPVEKDIKEGGFFALFPLGVLGLLSLFGGLLGIPHALGKILPFHPPHLLEGYLKPLLVFVRTYPSSVTEEIMFMGFCGLAVMGTAGLSVWLYFKHTGWLKRLKKKHVFLFRSFQGAWGVDEACQTRIVQPVLRLSGELFSVVEKQCFQNLILLLQKWFLSLKEAFVSLQSQKIQDYLLYMVLGLVVLILSMSFK